MILCVPFVVITMGIGYKKEEQLKKMPQIETKIYKSKDNKFIIHKTIITAIKPLAYYKAVLENDEYVVEDSKSDNLDLNSFDEDSLEASSEF